ncbi:alpha/beta hydrolase [Mycolicibacterium iranicum]|uniref:Alpha/beta hydrolase n=2 Tax=Mycolicibacterium iranicum TaxID=912594 RepID=A0A178LT98_MYCIR|nr:alpha/beta hydrolase [Mycolicibacterium iranicum]
MLSLVALAGCARSAADSTPAAPGLTDIGGGRALFLECQGSGAPTVFVIPGQGSYAEAWNYLIPPGDPIWSSRYDAIEDAELVPSPDAAQPTVARSTRICVYDRPDTRPDGEDRSTPVPQPHSTQQDVEDVLALIRSAGLPGPLVFAAHSYGGMILNLLAREHPDLVAGLVFVEPTSEFLTSVGTPAQNAAFFTDSRDRPGTEAVQMEQAFAAVKAAPPLPAVPAAVLSGDRFPPPEQLKADNYTQAQIHHANAMLAAALGTTNVVVPGSGHSMMLYQPRAVADAIIRVVDQVRGSLR